MLFDEVGVDMPRFFAWAKIERLEDLPVSKFEIAVQMAEEKRRRG